MTPLEVLDWRRCVSGMYATVRAIPDPQQAWRYWQDRRAELVATHPASMIAPADRRRFPGIHLFDHDPALRFAVETEPAEGKAESYQLGSDGALTVSPALRTAGLAGTLGLELTIYRLHGYGGGLFLPFRDATSGTETYGGGRYLLDTIKGADLGQDGPGRLVLDFNFAYFPSCAHSDAYVCPLSPPENALSVPVRAGERWPVT
ncbi:DUF1684 domain-containing protein [Minwuia sp.]|uniref:DUF1684 domain-containing protein n=1 Tax=Minwuia sp. TaxID=2493630 RepID=UPI003A91E779